VSALARLRACAVSLGLLAALLPVGAGPVTASHAATGAAAGTAERVDAQTVALPDLSPDGQWWFTAWQIPKVWRAGARGQGVTVAVVDSGVQASWPELKGVVLAGTDFQGGDGRVDRSQETEGNSDGHGTAMAIDIAGQGGPSRLVGVAPEARILPVQRRDTDPGVGEQIRWAVDHGAKIINLSYSIPGSCRQDDQVAVRYALDHGAVVVASAGNEAAYSQRGTGRPRNCLGVLAVTAIDNQLRAWSMSDRGPYVSLAAPGVHIQGLTLPRRRVYADGSSAAAALTSGAIALVWSKYPQLTNRQVVARVLATARDLGPPGKDDLYGYGGIRPYQAIMTEVSANAPNPIFDQLATAATSGASDPPATTAIRPGTSSDAGTGTSPSTLLVAAAAVIGFLALVAVIVVAAIVGRSRRGQRVPPGSAARR
jgi:subtilisin family serine protease